MNLALWNGYAQIERSSNRISEARKVYAGALGRYRSFPEQFRSNAPLLYHSYAKMEIEEGRHKTAMNILVNLAEEQRITDSISEIDVPVTRLLRARKSGEDPGELLQKTLNRALKLFPNNTMFLSLYFHEEVRGRIPLGFQAYLKESLHKNPSYILWTVAIYDELHRQQPYNIDRVRSLFDKASACPSTKNSISLWALYINFEIKHDELRRAKTLYYRAIRECPWSKDLYLMAFRELKSQFNAEELDEIMNVMIEKEIRLRISIEKFADNITSVKELLDPDTEVNDSMLVDQ
ncbi:6023_t:CDS:2 [Acaulospora colombiana]|uniref:6023_t:CDS:1 n=1 Tax=Acaulospora colombiana TaxID=27376 RepID=A0ACA9KGK6_9GLOM|nr:6023_t:CDS:2 [Acaulospora colombiana]